MPNTLENTPIQNTNLDLKELDNHVTEEEIDQVEGFLNDFEKNSNVVTSEDINEVELFLNDFESKTMEDESSISEKKSELVESGIENKPLKETEQFLLDLENPEDFMHEIQSLDEDKLEFLVNCINKNDSQALKNFISNPSNFWDTLEDTLALAKPDNGVMYRNLKSDLTDKDFDNKESVTGKETLEKFDDAKGLVYYKDKDNKLAQPRILLNFYNGRWNLISSVTNLDGGSTPGQDIESYSADIAGVEVESGDEIDNDKATKVVNIGADTINQEITTHYLLAEAEKMVVPKEHFSWFALDQIEYLNLDDKTREVITKTTKFLTKE